MSNYKLSNRMQAIVDMVAMSNPKKIVDIGCDHAYVSMEVAKLLPDAKLIAADVVDGPIGIAYANIRKEGLADRIEVRQSDGFEMIKSAEAELAIIAGMGGHLIIRILENKKQDFRPKLVLGPQSDLALVRHFLLDNNYTIFNEKTVCDEGKYYTLIKAYPTELLDRDDEFFMKPGNEYTKADYTYGYYSIMNKDETFRQFIAKEKDKKTQILYALDSVSRPSASTRTAKEELMDELALIESVIKKLG